jgi:hypothetical protein
MNIREYYDKMSAVYLHQLILIGIFLSLFLVVLSTVGSLFYMKWVLLTVFIILLYYFSRYLYFYYRKNQSSYKMPYKSNYTEPASFMVLLMPSEEYQIQLFMSNGISEWSFYHKQCKQKNNEVKPDTYTIINQNRPINAEVAFYKKSSNYAIIQTSQKAISHIELKTKQKNKTCFLYGKDEYILKKTGKSTRIIKNGIELASYEKGWMPISWQRNFSPNTPILHVNTRKYEEQLVIFTLLIGQFKNHI